MAEFKKYASEEYVQEEIAKIPVPDVSAQIEAHDEDETAHNNIYYTKPQIDELELITAEEIDAICSAVTNGVKVVLANDEVF